MRDRDIQRFAPAIDEDRVVVETNIELNEKPRWDAFVDDHFQMRKRLVRIMCQATNRLITRMRAGKRLDKIKGRLKDEKVRSREDAMRMVREDWKTA